jgi:3',5'-cyclic AMP phosphodiesterase CpdA
MKNLVLLTILVFSLLGLIAQDTQYANFAPTTFPDRIMMTIPGNPATSRAVSWRTEFSNNVSIGEITPANASPQLEKEKQVIPGTVAPWEEGSNSAMGHKVIFENLKTDTKYAYRVGDGQNWSEWFQFKTSFDRVEPFSFLYFGDVQNDIKSLGSRTIRQGYTHFPESNFMLFAGDLVSKSTEEYWREFFYAGGWLFGMVPSIATPGNHEYDKLEDQPRTFSKHWKQIYTFPTNGPAEKFQQRIYYFDYQGVRFISVDSPAIGESIEDGTLILNWLKQTLSGNPNQWSVVFTHYPVYSCSHGRDNEKYRDGMKTILEKHGVDIVLQGHDHTYCRGQNLGHVGDSAKNMPVYVVSVAGPKMYGLNTSFWSDRMASNTQLYQHLSFKGNVLNFQSFTVAGDLYDEFQIIKNNKGQNRFVESKMVGQIKQRTEIPASATKNYDEEELKKYQQKFK